MSNPFLKNIVRFVLLVALQVFVLNKIQLSGYINPYLYVLFILSLPFSIPGWLLLVSSMLMGLSIDVFSDTLGMHAAASVFMAFCRPFVISLVGTNEDMERGSEPGLKNVGFLWYLSYVLILVFLHHLMLFYIEVFRMNEFGITLVRVLINTVITAMLILIVQFLFFKPSQ